MHAYPDGSLHVGGFPGELNMPSYYKFVIPGYLKPVSLHLQHGGQAHFLFFA